MLKTEAIKLLQSNPHIKPDKKVKNGFHTSGAPKGDNVLKANSYVDKIKQPNQFSIAYSTTFSQQSKGFKNITYKKFDKMMKQQIDLGYYELLNEFGARKLYFDIDFENGTIEQYKIKRDRIFELFAKEGIIIGDDYVEYGYTGTKNDMPYISYHIIVNNGMCFGTQAETLKCIKYMVAKYPEIKKENDDLFDLTVYNKFRNFRLPYQSKDGNKNAIQSYDGEIGDTKDFLICVDTGNYYNTFDINDVKFAVDKEGEAIKKKFTGWDFSGYTKAVQKTKGEDFKLDMEKDDGTYEYLINSIPNTPDVSYNDFKAVGHAIHSVYQGSREGLRKWTEWTEGYDADVSASDLRGKYEAFTLNDCGVKRLTDYGNIFNPKIELKSNKMIDIYTIKEDTFKNHTKINQKYISNGCNLVEEIMNNKFTCIKSPMGSGKTKGVYEILNGDYSILFVSCKISFGNALYASLKPLGFINYQDKDTMHLRSTAQKLLCSIESMKHAGTKYDYVFYDESETLNSNLCDKMNLQNEPMMNNSKLTKIIKNCKGFIAMDAYFGSKSTNFIKDCMKIKGLEDESITYIENDYREPNRTYKTCESYKVDDKIKSQKDILIASIMKSVGDDKKIAVCSGSNDLLCRIHKTIVAKYPDKVIKFYNSSNKLENGTDVNKEWDKIDILMYSPTITAGISYDYTEGVNSQFDKLFLYIGSYNNPLARDLIQASRRIRDFKDKEMIVCISHAKHLINWRGKPTDINIIKKQQKRFVNELFSNDGLYSIEQIKDIEFLENVYYRNTQERNNNDCFLPEVMKYFMEYDKVTYTGAVDDVENWVKLEPKDTFKFADIEEITEWKFNEITAKREAEEDISVDEWNQYKKYSYINNEIKTGLDEDVIIKYYDTNLCNRGKERQSRHILNFKRCLSKNIINELVINDNHVVKVDTEINSGNVIEMRKNQDKKLYEVILNIFKHLKLYDDKQRIIDINRTFTTTEIESLISMYKDISPSSINKLLADEIYRNKNKAKKEFGTTNMMGIINTIFKDTFNLHLSKAFDSKRKTTKGVTKMVSSYRFMQTTDKAKKKETVNGFNIYKDKDESSWVETFEFLEEEETTEALIKQALTTDKRQDHEKVWVNDVFTTYINENGQDYIIRYNEPRMENIKWKVLNDRVEFVNRTSKATNKIIMDDTNTPASLPKPTTITNPPTHFIVRYNEKTRENTTWKVLDDRVVFVSRTFKYHEDFVKSDYIAPKRKMTIAKNIQTKKTYNKEHELTQRKQIIKEFHIKSLQLTDRDMLNKLSIERNIALANIPRLQIKVI